MRANGQRLSWQFKALDIAHAQYEHFNRDVSCGSLVEAHLAQRQLLPHVDVLIHFLKPLNFQDYSTPSLVLKSAPALFAFANLYINEGRNKKAHLLLSYICQEYPCEGILKIRALKAFADTKLRQFSRPQPSTDKLHSRLKEGRHPLKKAIKIAERLETEISRRKTKTDVLGSLARNYLHDGQFKKALKFALQVQEYWETQPNQIDGTCVELVDANLQIALIYVSMSQEPQVQ
jgi:hypothetical protein